MKKRVLYSVSVLVCLVVIFMIVYTSPKNIKENLEGIQYASGSESEVESVTIQIDGKLRRSLTGEMTYTGTIEISNEKLPVPKDQSEVVIEFDSTHQGLFTYTYVQSNVPKFHHIGTIFTNRNFNRIVIVRENFSIIDGSISDTTIISAPAKNKEEAIQVTNEVTKKFLKDNNYID
ncbi:hypothetical protein ACLIA0_08125 [Bacillaceae bacterium W0354]